MYVLFIVAFFVPTLSFSGPKFSNLLRSCEEGIEVSDLDIEKAIEEYGFSGHRRTALRQIRNVFDSRKANIKDVHRTSFSSCRRSRLSSISKSQIFDEKSYCTDEPAGENSCATNFKHSDPNTKKELHFVATDHFYRLSRDNKSKVVNFIGSSQEEAKEFMSLIIEGVPSEMGVNPCGPIITKLLVNPNSTRYQESDLVVQNSFNRTANVIGGEPSVSEVLDQFPDSEKKKVLFNFLIKDLHTELSKCGPKCLKSKNSAEFNKFFQDLILKFKRKHRVDLEVSVEEFTSYVSENLRLKPCSLSDLLCSSRIQDYMSSITPSALISLINPTAICTKKANGAQIQAARVSAIRNANILATIDCISEPGIFVAYGKSHYEVLKPHINKRYPVKNEKKIKCANQSGETDNSKNLKGGGVK